MTSTPTCTRTGPSPVHRPSFPTGGAFGGGYILGPGHLPDRRVQHVHSPTSISPGPVSAWPMPSFRATTSAVTRSPSTTDFDGANMVGDNLQWCRPGQCRSVRDRHSVWTTLSLSGADLAGADLSGINLLQDNVEGTNLTGPTSAAPHYPASSRMEPSSARLLNLAFGQLVDRRLVHRSLPVPAGCAGSLRSPTPTSVRPDWS